MAAITRSAATLLGKSLHLLMPVRNDDAGNKGQYKTQRFTPNHAEKSVFFDVEPPDAALDQREVI